MTLSLDSDSVALRIDGTGEVLQRWERYTYASEFLTPTDAWSFAIGDPRLYAEWRPKLPPFTRVTLEINGKPQCAGRVAGWRISGERGARGSIMEVFGYDMLGPLVWACVDPVALKFSAGMTLFDAVVRVATPFGFSVFATTDLVNRSVVTGNNPATTIRSTTASSQTVDPTTLAVSAGASVTTEYDPTRPLDLKSFTLQQLQPHWGEGAFSFLERLCKRFGLWLWCDTLGKTLIIGQPEFDQKPLYTITRRQGAGATYETSAMFETTCSDQPTVIIAEGKVAKNPNYPKALYRVAMVNELIGLNADGSIRADVQTIINNHPGCKVLPIRPEVREYAKFFGTADTVIPMFLKDDESKSIAQIEGFTRKEMGVRQGKSLKYACTVDGHTQNGIVWAVNTTCRVDDDVTGASGTFWIRSRTFTKDRGGTRTHLEMVPINMLTIGA